MRAMNSRWPIDEEPRDALGADGRGPARPSSSAISPKKSPRCSCAIGLRSSCTDDVAVEDDEELVADVALLGEHLVEADLDLVGKLADPFELPRLSLREERNAAKVVELLVGGHGLQCTEPGKGSAADGPMWRQDGRNAGHATDSVVRSPKQRPTTGLNYRRGTTNAPLTV